ncbi:hypothetical protein IV72_GL000343 [Atopobium minutum]|nr:hypothetical protein IV72_GL000343 [Atopobium minutum]
MTLLGHGTFRCSRGAGNPPQTGARWAPPFSYAEDLSDGIGYLLDQPISPYPLKSADRQRGTNAIASRDSAAAQCKRGRSCERPRDGDDGSEGRFLYRRFPFIAFTAFILYAPKRHQLACARVLLGVAHAPGEHESAVLRQVLAQHGDRHALDSRSLHKVAHGSLPDAHAARHEVERAHDAIGDVAFLELLLAGLAHQLPDAVLKPQLQFLEPHVAPGYGKRRVGGAPVGPRQNPGAVGATRNSVGAGNRVHHVAVGLLARVVHGDEARRVFVGKLLQRAEVAVVGRIQAVAARPAHLLEGVHYHQAHIGVLVQEAADLLYQAFAQARRRVAQEEALACDVGKRPKALLHALVGVLKAQVEHAALLGGEAPERASRAHGQSDGQAQPALPAFRRSRDDVPAQGQKVLDDPVGLHRRLLDEVACEAHV